MKNLLQVRIAKGHPKSDFEDYKAQVVIKGTMDAASVVDKMLADGLEGNKDEILDIITRFNKKTAELVFSGNQVDTGLVTLVPEVKGSLYRHYWRSMVNRPSVFFRWGAELLLALADTEVEVIDNHLEGVSEKDEDSVKDDKEVPQRRNPLFSRENFLLKDENPPCGIAFRRWLCNS